MPRRTVLLANLGTPRSTTAADVADFLREFLSDPLVVDYPRWLWRPVLEHLILRARPARVAAMYRSISAGTEPPLAHATREVAAALRDALPAADDVRATYRYGEPCLAVDVTAALLCGCDEIVVIPLFPQRTSASSETIIQTVLRLARAAGRSERVRVLRIEPDEPAYIGALAERVRAAAISAPIEPEHLVISFHGIPVRHDIREHGRYRSDCEATARALLAALGLPAERATISYQSRFGPEPWLRPATFSILRELARAGTKSVAVVTPGFLTAGLETLEEIGIRGRKLFLEAGGTSFVTAAPVGAHPAVIDALARAVTCEAPAMPGRAESARGVTIAAPTQKTAHAA